MDSIIDSWDILIDGSDNFPTRFILNDACVSKEIPLVYGAVLRFQGQVSVFWPAAPEGLAGTQNRTRPLPCYRCLFPEAPSAEDAPNCSVAGVLGVLPGIVGTLQANEALKLALGIGQVLVGRLLLFDALNMDFRQAKINANPQCPSCGGLNR